MDLNYVYTSLCGFVKANSGLKLYKNGNIVVRHDNDPNCLKVKLISGGGSGHEPSHIGYVGLGMLSAAICGDIFAAPSIISILNCILTVGNPNSNIIFIVNNYTGDRLNFGLAKEIASTKHGFKNIKILLVNDDCSINEENVKKSVGKRGLAGCVLLHKILGAMSALGKHTIEETFNFGTKLLESGHLCTLGFTFLSNRNSLKNIEIGKGIHGEPGVSMLPFSENFDSILEILVQKFSKRILSKSKIILLVNNLGGTSEFLMTLFVEKLLEKFKDLFEIERIYIGTFLSSLKQEGISVTLLKLEGIAGQDILTYMDYDVDVPCKLFSSKKIMDSVVKSEIIQSSSKMESLGCKMTENKLLTFKKNDKFGRKLTEHALTVICESLISCKDQLNIIDSECGDGDTGSTTSKGAEGILQALLKGHIDLDHPAILLQQLSSILQSVMGGSLGALYSLFFQSGSKAFLSYEQNRGVTIFHWSEALKYGNDAIIEHALTEIKDRTMLDPLMEGQIKLFDSISSANKDNILQSIEKFTLACEQSAKATQFMIPKSGRASYASSENQNSNFKYPDSGAHAVAIWTRALLEACKQIIIE